MSLTPDIKTILDAWAEGEESDDHTVPRRIKTPKPVTGGLIGGNAIVTSGLAAGTTNTIAQAPPFMFPSSAISSAPPTPATAPNPLSDSTRVLEGLTALQSRAFDHAKVAARALADKRVMPPAGWAVRVEADKNRVIDATESSIGAFVAVMEFEDLATNKVVRVGCSATTTLNLKNGTETVRKRFALRGAMDEDFCSFEDMQMALISMGVYDGNK